MSALGSTSDGSGPTEYAGVRLIRYDRRAGERHLWFFLKYKVLKIEELPPETHRRARERDRFVEKSSVAGFVGSRTSRSCTPDRRLQAFRCCGPGESPIG